MAGTLGASLSPAKQLGTLAKYEKRLRAAIARPDSDAKMTSAIARVRQAQLSVLKARRDLIRQRTATTALIKQLKRIEADETKWLALSDNEIVGRYNFSRT